MVSLILKKIVRITLNPLSLDKFKNVLNRDEAPKNIGFETMSRKIYPNDFSTRKTLQKLLTN